GDAEPILQNLAGPETPRDWQGALPFTYHVGPGPVKVKMHLKQNYRYWTIWNVIGKVKGTKYPDEWVVLGNHRDAWVYGAVDPNRGNAGDRTWLCRTAAARLEARPHNCICIVGRRGRRFDRKY